MQPWEQSLSRVIEMLPHSNMEGVFRDRSVIKPAETLSPIDKTVLDPRQILGNSTVITGDFGEHALGIGRTRSGTPGVDFDRSDLQTEKLTLGQRPAVTTPVAGRLTMLKQNPWGTARVIDRNGWTHTFVHNAIEAPAPSGKPYFGVSKDQEIPMGSPFGYLYNEGTQKDHVHYYLQSPDGSYVDPMNVYRSKFDGAVEGIIDDMHEKRIMQQLELLEQMESDGDGFIWNDEWDRVFGIA